MHGSSADKLRQQDLKNLTKCARCEWWTAAVEITVDGVLQTEQNNDLPQPLDVRSDRIYPINA